MLLLLETLFEESFGHSFAFVHQTSLVSIAIVPWAEHSVGLIVVAAAVK